MIASEDGIFMKVDSKSCCPFSFESASFKHLISYCVQVTKRKAFFVPVLQQGLSLQSTCEPQRVIFLAACSEGTGVGNTNIAFFVFLKKMQKKNYFKAKYEFVPVSVHMISHFLWVALTWKQFFFLYFLYSATWRASRDSEGNISGGFLFLSIFFSDSTALIVVKCTWRYMSYGGQTLKAFCSCWAATEKWFLQVHRCFNVMWCCHCR